MEKKYILLNNELMQKKDGFYQLEKDKEAVTEFQKEVDSKMFSFNSFIWYIDRIQYLIDNNYYENIIQGYTKDEIEELAKLVYGYNFKFQSFMAISKFYQSYALKTNDGKQYLEYYEDRIIAVALFLAKNSKCKNHEDEFNIAKVYAEAMIKQEMQPATPTFLNAGRARRGEMTSCFLLSCDDSLNSIYHTLNTAAQLSKVGGGIAVSLDNLRSRGEEIKGIEGAASGVLPVMKLLEDTSSYVNQLG